MKPRKKKAKWFTLTLIPKGGTGAPLKLIHGTPWMFAAGIAALVVLSGLLCSFLILLTPFREIFPGSMSVRQQMRIAEQAARVDSMIHEMDDMQRFTDRMKYMVGLRDNRGSVRLTGEVAGVSAGVGGGGIGILPAKIVRGRISQKFTPSRSHYGIDIATSSNEPVGALADGHVLFAGWTVDSGSMMIIDHGSLVGFYKHCGSLLKKNGAYVRRGEVIALAGRTGIESSGVHLHLELWRAGVPVDPEHYIIEK
jgi:hypothetical protein